MDVAEIEGLNVLKEKQTYSVFLVLHDFYVAELLQVGLHPTSILGMTPNFL